MATRISLNSAVTARNQLAAQQAKQIKQIYENAAEEIEQSLKHLEGKDNVSSVLRTQYLQELEAQVNHEINVISSQTQTVISQSMLQSATLGTKAAQAFNQTIGISVGGAYYSGIASQAVIQVATGQVYQNGWGLSERIWGIDDKLLQDMHNIIAKDIALNKGAYDIAKDIEKYVSPSAQKLWDWAKVYPGTNLKVDYNAQRLARTLVAHAYQQSFKATWEKNPWTEGYRWVTQGGDRTCEECIARASDDAYGLGPGVFPKDALPLDHPNGLCSWEVVVTKSLSDIGDEIADWLDAEPGTYPEIDAYAEQIGARPK